MRFSRFRVPTVAGAAVLALGLAFLWTAVPLHAEPASKTEAAKDAANAGPLWSKQCVKSPDGAKEACFVQQLVYAMPQRTILLKSQFGYLGPDGKPRLILTAPLGILLPPGLVLAVDQAKPLAVPLESCEAGGCRSVIDMDAPALDSFRNGKQMTVRFVTQDRKVVDLPVKLDGLAAALKSLAAPK